ncbi:MAG TPA: dTDP-4-dehydrorhamnose reductase [Rhodospirillales bacterium]|nr:dTDP-4-dehydrorhamnose reductase [Flavobacteriales bacterium]HIN75376.1 dTDP-4-dehydrorhamnose reductase [Rhodospirillales bacterium]
MLKRVLVTGKNGQLGLSIAKIAQDYPQYDMTFVGRDQLDLSQSQTIIEYFQSKTFNVIINCAAHTAVDKAESDPEIAIQVNYLAVKQMAKIAKDQNAILIHISTDYVFNGKNHKPYVETDPVDPINLYGQTKLKGEQSIYIIQPKGMVIRTSWLYSEFGDNFVKTMLRLGKERENLDVIYDQVGSPTFAGDLAKAIFDMLSRHFQFGKESLQTFHFSNEGICSWYDFAKTIFELSNIHCRVNPIETKDYPTPAKRPHYSVLNKLKIRQGYMLEISYWKDSLATCLNELEKI